MVDESQNVLLNQSVSAPFQIIIDSSSLVMSSGNYYFCLDDGFLNGYAINSEVILSVTPLTFSIAGYTGIQSSLVVEFQLEGSLPDGFIISYDGTKFTFTDLEGNSIGTFSIGDGTFAGFSLAYISLVPIGLHFNSGTMKITSNLPITSPLGITTGIVSEKYQCPVCGEKDYIMLFTDGSKLCLSCGYQDRTSKMSQDFIPL